MPKKNQPALILIFVVLFGLPIGYSIYERYWLMFPVGAPCVRNNQCRGLRSLCLPFAQPRKVGIMVTLPPDGTPGVCSTTCDSDSDCPSTMSCVKGGIYEVLPGQWQTAGEPTHRTMLCAPRS